MKLTQANHDRPTSGLNRMRARRIGIDTQQEAVVFMHKDCHVCRSEGFTAHARIYLKNGQHAVIATLYQVTSDIISPGEAGLSESTWRRLGLKDGGEISVGHPRPLDSLSLVRGKIYGRRLQADDVEAIVADITAGRYSDIHISSFVTACSALPLDFPETVALTKAMVAAGETLTWPRGPVVDKHCIGGLPGNRTTPIVVAIAVANGLIMPKTSSRAITSPAGTADTMETMAPVDLNLAEMRGVVEKVGGCVVWGGAVKLSPADDTLIRVERALDLDSQGQLVASVLSKKIAAGASHVLLDVPVGPTAKVRGAKAAEELCRALEKVAAAFGLKTRLVMTDGTQPVGRGIGPALEARDVLSVLRGDPGAPADLKARALALAGPLLEMGAAASAGAGRRLAADTLRKGRAWAAFQQICEAQGGMREPPVAAYREPVLAERPGRLTAIDNRRIARIAKLAGAPAAKAAGLDLHVRLGDKVEEGTPLYSVHAESQGELAYALDFVRANPGVLRIEER